MKKFDVKEILAAKRSDIDRHYSGIWEKIRGVRKYHNKYKARGLFPRQDDTGDERTFSILLNILLAASRSYIYLIKDRMLYRFKNAPIIYSITGI